MLDWRTSINKPEYFFRPRQFLRRLQRSHIPQDGRLRRLTLPWGLDIDVRVDETIGMAIWRLGLYDLVVSEALWRLADPGDRAADIGANIGHMTSLLARRLGERGLVTSFEPLPDLFQRLENNVERWRLRAHTARVNGERVALSDRVGKAELVLPGEIGMNSGVAYLKDTRADAAATRVIEVEVRTLDDYYSDQTTPQLIKIDVEGAELSVFRGGDRVLRSPALRDIVFEENTPLPTTASLHLQGLGFTLFRLEKGFFGPRLADPRSLSAARLWEPPNYLATRDVSRTVARFQSRGWHCL